MYSMVPVVNYTVLYIWNLLRDLTLSILTTRQKMVTISGDEYVS